MASLGDKKAQEIINNLVTSLQGTLKLEIVVFYKWECKTCESPIGHIEKKRNNRMKAVESCK